MDKAQFALMAPWMIASIVVVYYLIARRKPKSKEAELYHSIIFDGCQNCGGDFQVVYSDITKGSEMTIECRKCANLYKIDHSLQYAWRIK